MSENRWWSALGVEEPKDEGGKEQEVAEPASDTGSAGGKEQEVAEPAGTEGEDLNDTGDSDPEQEEQEQEEQEEQEKQKSKAQTAEARRAAAAKRREQERAAYEAELTKKFNERLAAAAKGIKLRGGNGSSDIVSLEDLEELAAATAHQKLERELGQGKLSRDSLEQAILNTPGVKEVLDAAKASKEQAAAAELAANQSRYLADMAVQLAEIRKIDPSIKSIDDVIRMETGPKFAEYVRRGVSPVEAFKLANHEAIVQKARSAGAQAQRNAAAGKAHMKPAAAGGKAGVEITDAIRANYRRFIPNITDEQIARYEANKGGS